MTKPLNGCLCQDGKCDSCNRVVEAWEAMREALCDIKASINEIEDGSDVAANIAGIQDDCLAALMLAEKVSR